MPIILTRYQMPIFNTSCASTNETCHLFLNCQDEKYIFCHNHPCVVHWSIVCCNYVAETTSNLYFLIIHDNLCHESMCNLSHRDKKAADNASGYMGGECKKKSFRNRADWIFFMRCSSCTSSQYKISFLELFGSTLQRSWPPIHTLPEATAVNGSPDDNSEHYNPTYCHVNLALQETTQRSSIECWWLHVILFEREREEDSIASLDSSECSLYIHTCVWTTCDTHLILGRHFCAEHKRILWSTKSFKPIGHISSLSFTDTTNAEQPLIVFGRQLCVLVSFTIFY